MSRRTTARVALVAVLAICGPASAAYAHPGGHGGDAASPVTPAPAPTSAPGGGGGGSSPLLIAAVVLSLLALGGGLAYLKQKQTRAEAARRGEAQPPARDAASLRKRRLQIAGGGAIALLATGLLWLFGPGGSGPEKPDNLASKAYLDGTLTVVEDRRLVMKTFDTGEGEEVVEFTIRERDAENFDLAHLRSHSSVALPTRVYYERSGGRLYGVYKEDAPANSTAD